MNGRDPMLPGEAKYIAMDTYVEPGEYAAKISKTLSQAWKRAAATSLQYQAKYKEYYDRRAKHRPYRVGDLVLMQSRAKLRSQFGNKMHPDFDRLFRVRAVVGPRLKLVPVGSPTEPERWTNMSMVKPFMGSEEGYLGYEYRLREIRLGGAVAVDQNMACRDCGGTYEDDLHSTEPVRWIQCDFCLQWQHWTCGGLQDEPVDAVWHCRQCTSALEAVDEEMED
jgi:hypothetical protein